jgi:hypothetical protein
VLLRERVILFCVAALAATITVAWVTAIGWAIGRLGSWVL